MCEKGGSATGVYFSQQPAGTSAGQVNIDPEVSTRDQFGNPTTVASVLAVTLSLTAGSGVLAGTLTKNISSGNGSVTFGDIHIDLAGGNKQLTAAAPGFSSIASAFFAISPASANRLVLTTPPAAVATAGVAFA